VLISAFGMIVLVGAMVFDSVSCLGDGLLAGTMIAGMVLIIGGFSCWLDAQD
jgi:hypothetical protein